MELRRFDEAEDAEAWSAGRVPGAPFAVALSPAGVVLAKGTVNDARQLASVVDAARCAGAERRTSRRAFLGRAGTAAAVPPAPAWSARWSGPATPTPTTSAATSTRPTAARTRPACRGSIAAGCRCGRATARRSTTWAA